MAYVISKKKILLGLLALVMLWYMLSTPKRENFHDRGVGPGRLFGCGCNGLSATSAYRNVHPLFIQPGKDGCTSCLGTDDWCKEPEPVWADPPPLDYRVPKEACFC